MVRVGLVLGAIHSDGVEACSIFCLAGWCGRQGGLTIGYPSPCLINAQIRCHLAKIKLLYVQYGLHGQTGEAKLKHLSSALSPSIIRDGFSHLGGKGKGD